MEWVDLAKRVRDLAPSVETGLLVAQAEMVVLWLDALRDGHLVEAAGIRERMSHIARVLQEPASQPSVDGEWRRTHKAILDAAPWN